LEAKLIIEDTKTTLENGNAEEYIKRTIGLISLVRFNDYDIGLLGFHAVGMTIKNLHLTLDHEDPEQVQLVSKLNDIYYNIHRVYHDFQESDKQALEINAGPGFFQSFVKPRDGYQRLCVCDSPSIDEEAEIRTCRAFIKSEKDKKKVIITFGKVVRGLLSHKSFASMIDSTIKSFDDNTAFENDDIIEDVMPLIVFCKAIFSK